MASKSTAKEKQIQEWRKQNASSSNPVKESRFSSIKWKKLLLIGTPILGAVSTTLIVGVNEINANNQRTLEANKRVDESSSNKGNDYSDVDKSGLDNSPFLEDKEYRSDDIEESSVNHNAFMKSLEDIKNVDYSTTISKLNTGTNQVVSHTYNDVDNLVLTTKKDAKEYQDNANALSSLEDLMVRYRSSWLDKLQNEVDSLKAKYNNDFAITSIIPRVQYSFLNWNVDTPWYVRAGYEFHFDNADTSPYDNEIGDYWSGTGDWSGLIGAPYHGKTYSFSDATPNGVFTWNNYNTNLIGTSQAKNGFTYDITPFHPTNRNTKGSQPYAKVVKTELIYAMQAGYYPVYTEHFQKWVNAIENSTYNFWKDNWNSSPNSIDKLRTFPDNSGFSGFMDINHYYDYYRGLLEWTTRKLDIYDFDSNSYKFKMNGNYVIDNQGSKISEVFKDKNIKNENWYYIKGQGSQKVNPNWKSYFDQRSNDEQNILNLYDQKDLKTIVTQVNIDKNNFDKKDLASKTQAENINVFGDNTSFSISKQITPYNVDTNYGDFNISRNSNNEIIKFNNFLPVLSSQIVLDSQSANPNFESSKNNGIYKEDSGLKFKLSENITELSNVINFYNENKSKVDSIDINDEDIKTRPHLVSELNKFKNYFETFSFRNDSEILFSDLFSELKNKQWDDALTTLSKINVKYDCQKNSERFQELIRTIFKVNDISSLFEWDDTSRAWLFKDDVKNTLLLIPNAIKNTLENNDIVADATYGDNASKTTVVIYGKENKDSKSRDWNNIKFDLTRTSETLLSNNEAEIKLSNIRFREINNDTQMNDEKNFINKENSNFDYLLNEYKSYSENKNQNTLKTDNQSITYKLKYNPNFANWEDDENAIDNVGVKIDESKDIFGYKASEYVDDSTNKNKKNIVLNSVTDYLKTSNWIKPEITSDSVVIVNSSLNNVDSKDKSIIEQIANTNNLVLNPNDTSGDFYALVDINNSNNFLNPEGDNLTKEVIKDKIWYVDANKQDPRIKTYLVKLNAAKKYYNVSDLSFDTLSGDPGTITWNINDSSNYYYQTNNVESEIQFTPLNKIEKNQKIYLKNQKYIELVNDIGGSNSISYANLKSKLSQYFYKYYKVLVDSISVNDGYIDVVLKV